MRTLRASAVTVAISGALLAGAPALAHATTETPSGTETCTPTATKSAAPAVGGSTTVTVGSAGTVTLKRMTSTRLRIMDTTVSTGYFVRVVTRVGDTVKAVFRQQGSTARIRVSAHIGNSDKKVLFVYQNSCT